MRTQSAADAIYDEGALFLRCFGALCKLSVELNRHEFIMKPKCHVPRLVLFGAHCVLRSYGIYWWTPKDIALGHCVELEAVA